MPEDAPETEEKTEEETGEEAEEKLNPTVTVEDLGPCKQRLNIEVAADAVTAEVDKAYKKLLDSVDVPGFRRGHVPRSIAERKFGKQINEELGQSLTSRAFVEALEAGEMDAIGKPEFGEVKLEQGKPLAFEATVYLKPQVEIEDCKGIPLRKKPAEVTDKDVDERIEMLCKARAPLAPVDRGAEAGDLVTFDFKITADGKELRSIEEARLAIDGESLFGIKVDRLEKVFGGRKTGDEFEFDVTLPDNFREEEYREKPARIQVKMKEVKAPRLPEINDEWAKSLDFDDLEDMRDEFKAAGLIVKKPSISDVEVGIDRVYAAHNAGRIKVFDTLEAYFDEKASYARVLDDAGGATDEIEDKADYHIMDCERYLWALLGEQRGLGESVVVPPYDPLSDLHF